LQYRVNFLERNANGGTMPTVVATNINDLYKAGDSFNALVCPGDYDVVLSDEQRINAWGESPAHKIVFDTQHITVGQTEINGLVLTPRPMASIKGVVQFEGISRNASCPGIGGQRLRILRGGDGQFQTALLDDKNRFEFHNVAPGDYTIYLGPFLREAVYLKSIMVDGTAANGRRFSIKEAKPVTVEVTLSGDVAHAAGHISPDVRGEPRWDVAWTRPKGSVGGKVEGDGDDGSFTLILRSARYNSNASAEYAAQAAADGSFRFNAVDPGVYTLRAVSKNSLTYEYGAQNADKRGTPIIVGRGAHIEGLTLAPPKLSTICGRVTDANGTPQAGTRIFVETFYDGYLHGREKTGELVTDLNGRFRAERLLPGEYFLAFPWGARAVFFSSDGSLSAATPVRLRVGESVGCGAGTALDLRIPIGIDKTHTISGEVLGDLPAKVGDRFWVSLIWDVNTSSGQAYVASAKLDNEHRFRIDRVPNGRFLLQLHSAYGPEPMVWSGPYGPVSHLLATQSVEVHDEDVRDVEITPMRLPSVTGTVHFEHIPAEWKAFEVSAQHITLIPRTYQAPFSAKLSSDGSFSIDPEDPGDNEVQIGQLRDLYIRSVRLDGHEIRGRYFHLSPNQSAHLEVEVSGDSGQVDASVTPDPSLPLPEPPVRESCGSSAWPEYQLILFPDPLFIAEGERASSVEPRVFFGYRVGSAEHPTLQIRAVPPGHYRALAAEHLSKGLAFGRRGDLNDDQRKLWGALAALGRPLTVQAGEKLEIVLPDRTVDVARLAASFSVPLESSLLNAW
jgi:hypothetical protein